jgi:8-hydroxy-5-deazaflavin:NADPH oxidoreductase
MASIKTIAIVGATGSMGSAIANALSKNKKYRLLLMSTDETKLVGLKLKLQKAGAEVYALSCAKEASWEADIIFVATPYGAEKDVAEKIRDVVTGKVVISISNPQNSSYTRVVTSGSSAAEELQKLLPNSKVVKTFTTTFANDIVTPGTNAKTSTAFIAGNNSKAVHTVSELMRTVGFNPILAGDLSVSRTLERMQPLLIQLTLKQNYYGIASWEILHH